MKSLMFVYFLLFSIQALAADVNLSPGDTMVIEANRRTQVACAGGENVGETCRFASEAFKGMLNSCNGNSFYIDDCLLPYYASALNRNPDCVSELMIVCIEACNTRGSACVRRCNR